MTSTPQSPEVPDPQPASATHPCAGQSGVAVRLNRYCHCVTVDRARLGTGLGLDNGSLALAPLPATHPHLFSDSAVFVESAQLACMQRLVSAIETVVALPGWQAQAIARAGVPAAVATRDATAARGMFLGYDFHLGANGPQLIEINTNAGGMLLNTLLRSAQVACCEEVGDALRGRSADAVADDIVTMFRHEWQRARGGSPMGTIAIVDDEPRAQFLYPEFERFVALLKAHGMTAVIADAAALVVRDDALWFREQRIDFVYNRLTDFLLTGPHHAALAEAWQRGLALVSPHPRAWALYADKRNLVTLTDAPALRALGVEEDTIAILLAGIPRTVLLSAENAQQLWTERRQWFFKPAAGYASKAAYRGDKLTRGKWEEILAAGGYIAQALVPPSERHLLVDGEERPLKIDVRNYVYDGRVQLVSARLYQGQTTNLRTPGGGFAPVFAVG
ncbi:MAG: hypothetical protein ACLGHG_10140 [Gammaproteobacteria bacterium]